MDNSLKENSHASAEDWKTALKKVVPAVVVIRMTTCRSFDTESASSGSATGFIVDKKCGIILTNRHVVQPGPVVAEAMFVNREEIPIYPIYRDPVHDFGFFRYDPAAIKFLNYDEIPLAPEAACVGLEIRVVGNDSGEKISILSSTLARLDRDAPHYKGDGYNDFNTFYIQAASGTKGGSSGSPVIDCQGRAVALNAGGKSSSSSAFYYPLQRVVRALNLLQKGRDSCHDKWEAVVIPRGTLQATFVHKGFDEIRRLGLQNETEQVVRDASPLTETGMLVVDSVVPGGPAFKHLKAGDVLVRMNGQVITQFLKMETTLDDSVGDNVELEFERRGTPFSVHLLVQDLHSITPNYFLEVSGAVIHPLSYQQARNFRLECGLVYVSDRGHMFYRAGVPWHAIITKFAGVNISRLEDFIDALSKLSRGARVPLEYIDYNDRHRKKSVLITMDRHEWYAPPQIYTRDDTSGIWIRNLALPLTSQLMTNLVTDETHADVESDNGTTVSKDLSANGIVINDLYDQIPPKHTVVSDDHCTTSANFVNASVAEHVIEPSLVSFDVYVPSSCMLDGIHAHRFNGTGVIIYHSKLLGLVAVDRNTVVISSSDVILSFSAFPIEVPGEVVFLHPVYNYAIIAYDPSALGPTGASLVRAAELLPEPALRRGEKVYLVGLHSSLQVESMKSVVTNPCLAVNCSSADSPRYRATNMEVIDLDNDFGSSFAGVLTDKHGRVKALWASFSIQVRKSAQEFVGGIPIHSISRVLNKIISKSKSTRPILGLNGIRKKMPLIRVLEVELFPILLSKARTFGLSDNWIQALVNKDPVRHQVLQVKGCLAGSKAENLLEEGDMVLAIDKKPVTCFNDIDDACNSLDIMSDDDIDDKLALTIFRQGREIEIYVGTDIRDGNGTTRVISWCGCYVQDPHPEVRALGFLPKEGHGVYVSRWSQGSPVYRYGLYSDKWIVEVNGNPTPNLDAFVNVTKEIEDGEFVHVRTVELNGKPKVVTLKQDLHYWPTWELRCDPETSIWHRNTIKSL
ncbi:protease Do-like 7 [Rutidosis leptorrhynchoides]|uniref:protease Do-like 7 n=1 Tax=Rutidosis leptorrhynchoides TaxID=125765 RepID=UPI003A9A2A9E